MDLQPAFMFLALQEDCSAVLSHFPQNLITEIP